ncbi:MAG TPA: citrate synthase [Chloroflexia bacterium]|nr:citrate synthase [Chloroflexia bacterium]
MTTEVRNETPAAKGGLEGIVAATTALSKVEGSQGRLIYRGYNIHDLAQNVSFEEVAFLLWHGRLPVRTELEELLSAMEAERSLPVSVLEVLKALPASTDPMDALRTAVSAWGAALPVKGTPTIQQAIALTARIPVILAAFDRLRRGLEPVPPRSDLDHAANYLYMLNGVEPSTGQVRALNAYLVMLADHGMNASTFTARVVASTQSDLVSSIVAAIGALKGPLHGGAPAKVLDMLEAIKAAGGASAAERWLRAALARGDRLMGFGHRVYKTSDPRAEELRTMAEVASPAEFKLALQIEELALALLAESKPGRRLYTNVEYYSAVLLASVGLPGDLFTPTFAASRTAGWTAHVLEQVANNRLIRPEAEYTGPLSATFVPMDKR